MASGVLEIFLLHERMAIHPSEMGFRHKRRSHQVKCVLGAAVMMGLGPELPGRS